MCVYEYIDEPVQVCFTYSILATAKSWRIGMDPIVYFYKWNVIYFLYANDKNKSLWLI